MTSEPTAPIAGTPVAPAGDDFNLTYTASVSTDRWPVALLRWLAICACLALSLLYLAHPALTAYAHALRQPYFDQFRQSVPLLTLPFPANVLALENAHRPVLPNLIWLADLEWAAGDQSVLLAGGWLACLAVLGLLVVIVQRDRALGPASKTAAIPKIVDSGFTHCRYRVDLVMPAADASRSRFSTSPCAAKLSGFINTAAFGSTTNCRPALTCTRSTLLARCSGSPGSAMRSRAIHEIWGIGRGFAALTATSAPQIAAPSSFCWQSSMARVSLAARCSRPASPEPMYSSLIANGWVN